jgi:hypothetical protein
MRFDQSQFKFDMNKNQRNFYVYFNILICLTLSTLFIVAIQYHSIQNFKYLFNSDEIINRTITTMMMDAPSSQNNLTLNHTIIRLEKTIFNIHFNDNGTARGGNGLRIFLGIGQSSNAEKS